MTRASILIETEVGKSGRVADKLISLAGVQTVDRVTGPYDVVAVAEAPDLNELGDQVTIRVHAIDGITRTVTCLSMAGSQAGL